MKRLAINNGSPLVALVVAGLVASLVLGLVWFAQNIFGFITLPWQPEPCGVVGCAMDTGLVSATGIVLACISFWGMFQMMKPGAQQSSGLNPRLRTWVALALALTGGVLIAGLVAFVAITVLVVGGLGNFGCGGCSEAQGVVVVYRWIWGIGLGIAVVVFWAIFQTMRPQKK